MARSCQCWKTYTCLLCEDIANGKVIINEEGIIRKVVRVSTPRTYTPRVVAQCGTRSGYKRHRANGEEACDECKSAQNEGVKKYMASKRERVNANVSNN